jgi:hypothetical protein
MDQTSQAQYLRKEGIEYLRVKNTFDMSFCETLSVHFSPLAHHKTEILHHLYRNCHHHQHY